MSIQNATLRPALTLAAAVVLAGCAGAQSDFQCNATAGDTCMTMEAANDRARDELGWAPERDLAAMITDAWRFESERARQP